MYLDKDKVRNQMMIRLKYFWDNFLLHEDVQQRNWKQMYDDNNNKYHDKVQLKNNQ